MYYTARAALVADNLWANRLLRDRQTIPAARYLPLQVVLATGDVVQQAVACVPLAHRHAAPPTKQSQAQGAAPARAHHMEDQGP